MWDGKNSRGKVLKPISPERTQIILRAILSFKTYF
jgi:hypothetical protein